MTIKELSQYYMLNREIRDLEEKIRMLEARATSATQDISGMPYSGERSDKTAIGGIISDTRDLLLTRKIQADFEYNRLERYISSVSDSRIRLILTHRFVDLWSWTKIAMSIGGGNTESSVKKAVYRFLEKNP